VLVWGEHPALKKRDIFIQHRVVARGGDVLERRVHQPESIVREARAHTLPARLVPPVLDVAFDKLTRGRTQQMRADEGGRRKPQRHHVLKLIAEAERAAGLIEGGSPPDAARQALIEQPPVHHDVEGTVGRPDGERTEKPIPETDRLLQRVVNGRELAVGPHERARGLRVGGIAEQAHHRSRL
jgi:hypothetical protein